MPQLNVNLHFWTFVTFYLLSFAAVSAQESVSSEDLKFEDGVVNKAYIKEQLLLLNVDLRNSDEKYVASVNFNRLMVLMTPPNNDTLTISMRHKFDRNTREYVEVKKRDGSSYWLFEIKSEDPVLKQSLGFRSGYFFTCHYSGTSKKWAKEALHGFDHLINIHTEFMRAQDMLDPTIQDVKRTKDGLVDYGDLNRAYVQEQLSLFQSKMKKSSLEHEITIDYENKVLLFRSSLSDYHDADIPMLMEYKFQAYFERKSKLASQHWSLEIYTDFPVINKVGRGGLMSTRYYYRFYKGKNWKNPEEVSGLNNMKNIIQEFQRAYPDETAKYQAFYNGELEREAAEKQRIKDLKKAEVDHFGEQVDALVAMLRSMPEAEVYVYGKNDRDMFTDGSGGQFTTVVKGETSGIMLVLQMSNGARPSFAMHCLNKDEDGSNRSNVSVDGRKDYSLLVDELTRILEFDKLSVTASNLDFSSSSCGPFFDVKIESNRNARAGELAFIFFYYNKE